MYKSNDFQLYELYPKDFYEIYKSSPNTLWRMWDDRILRTAQAIKKKYSCSFYVNDWWWGGKFQYSGWRPFACLEGARLSQHKFFHALDLKPDLLKITPEEIRQDILAKPWAEEFKFITCIELDTPTWLHISSENWDKSKYGILTIKP